MLTLSLPNHFKTFLKGISLFCRATDTPVLHLWYHLPWLLKPVWIPYLYAFLSAYNGFLIFTSGVTPADVLMTSLNAHKSSQNLQLSLAIVSDYI